MSSTSVACVGDAAFRWARSGAVSFASISLLGCTGSMVTGQGCRRSPFLTLIVAQMTHVVAHDPFKLPH